MNNVFKFVIILLGLLLNCKLLTAQQIYFPPITGSAWATVSPVSLGWSADKIDSLYSFLEKQNSRAFIVLKDGKIVLEKYFGTFTQDSTWYWASAGKTLTSFLIGKAQEDGFLTVSDTTSKYLGTGWTSCTVNQENKITVWHQLTMTTGLNDNVPDNHNTLPANLIYLADAGTRWAYHNAPYTLLEKVLTTSTEMPINTYTQTRLKSLTGMTGQWQMVDFDNVFFSKARSMARYGLLIQNNCIWNTDTLLSDTNYIHQMTNSSQNLNLSYGYLWWLNGKASYILPTSQYIFSGSYAPDAPVDMIAGLGKNGQILSVSKSLGLVIIRMGKLADNGEVPTQLCNSIWQKLNKAMNTSIESNIQPVSPTNIQNYPNPFNPATIIKFELAEKSIVKLTVYNSKGQLVENLINSQLDVGSHTVSFNAARLESGVYFCQLKTANYSVTQKMILCR